ncbi:MAG TPA: hypothetical protein DIW81_18390, partial [Planctomycetaceae bacterium]|nr:hypothetical protein [Planctomycetaceae bacterium]
MRRMIAAIAVTAMLSSAGVAQARGLCGACNYHCCPPVACQQTACYTTCKVERETCYRTVYENVCEPQQYT